MTPAVRHPQTVYRGQRTGAGVSVKIEDPAIGVAIALEPRFDHGQLAGMRFDWGNPSVGAAQLAFSLLADATGEPGLAKRHYMRFKESVIAHLERNEWTMTVAKLRELVLAYEGTLSGR